MSHSAVEQCVDDARADHARQGGISADDFNRLAAARNLEASEVAQVIATLSRFGIEIEVSIDLGLMQALSESGDSVGRMLRSAGKVPLLTAAEETKLGRRIMLGQLAAADTTSGKDQVRRSLIEDGRRAHDHLVLANIRLVVSIARKYSTSGMELSDLIQEGMLGVMRAADKFDHRLGYKFSTYATWWIRQNITRGMADKSRLIRLPVHFVESVSAVHRTRQLLEKRLNRSCDLVELAAELQMDPGKVQAILDLAREPVSIDELFPDSDTELVQVLSLYSDDVEEQVIEQMTREAVARALGILAIDLQSKSGGSARAAEMLSLRFGIEDGEAWTLDAIGTKFGVTRERARQIISNTLKSPALKTAFWKLDPRLETRDHV